MSRCLLLALCAALCCGLASASSSSGSSQLYSSLQPANYTLRLSFSLTDVPSEPLPCTSGDCLPQVSVPNGDSVTITYSGPSTPGNTVSLMYCFSNSSAVDRPWRKANPTISKDKKCNVAKPFAEGLPTGDGSYTWTPGSGTPPGTYNIQLLEVVAGSDPTTYAAMGRSLGFFTIVPIDSRPTWLIILVGVFCTFGPITLTGFFVWEKMIKKEK